MTYFNKDNESFQYKKHLEDNVVEVKESEEEVENMELEKVRERIKYYVDKYSESDYSDIKNFIE